MTNLKHKRMLDSLSMRPSRFCDKLKTKKNIGFLVGQGGGNGLPSSLLMRTPIGASTITNAFCYPRAKLLGIYRDSRTFSSLHGVADGFVEVSGIRLKKLFLLLFFILESEQGLK